MDERRGFFRIKNNGTIHAKTSYGALDVIDISSSGILIKKNNTYLQSKGIIELNIDNFSMPIHYEVSKTQGDTIVLIFENETEINKLFPVLKNLRNRKGKRAYN